MAELMTAERLAELEALKITPGPWSAISGPMGHLGKTKVADKLGLVAVCEIRISEGKCVPHGEANAQLIAAAPALLSYLRAAHDEIERLKRVADQAIYLGTIHMVAGHDLIDKSIEEAIMDAKHGWQMDATAMPDLVAYLRESGEPVEGE